jgi:hypothetical protein
MPLSLVPSLGKVISEWILPSSSGSTRFPLFYWFIMYDAFWKYLIDISSDVFVPIYFCCHVSILSDSIF